MIEDKDRPELKVLTKEMLDNLTEEEKEDFKVKFGIDLDSPLTPEIVKKHYGITRERIREIEEKALKKLKKGKDDDPDAA